MSIDELATTTVPAPSPGPKSRWRMAPLIGATLAALTMAAIGGWAIGNNAASSGARAHHDALVESVGLMPPMWEQLQLPVDERSQAAIESGARLGGPTSEMEVTPQLRVNEPNRIGVATTVRSDGITTLLVAIVRNDAGGNSSALGNGCEVGTTIDGMSCEDWVNAQFNTFTAPSN